MRRFLALAVTLLLASCVVACGDGDGDDDRGDGGSARSDDGGGDIAEMGDGGGFDLDVFGGDDDGAGNEEVIEVIQDFWEDRGPDIGLDFERLGDDRVSAVPGPDGEDGPVCFGRPIRPEDVAMNAFAVPCPEGLTVSWDPELLDGRLTDLYGRAGPAVVFAHEFGHIVQFQSGILDITGQGAGNPPTVIIENQADCFAGAWVAQAVDDDVGPFADSAALDGAIGALIEVRDPVGVAPDAPFAHGNGFDRVRAFQDGVDRGVEHCATYIERPPVITQLPFTDSDDQANQGNLPFDQVVDLLVEDLDDFFGENVDDFDEPVDPFDFVAEDDLEDLHADIGDGSVATVFGVIWAQAAQRAAGDGLDGRRPLLQRACLVGAWLGDVLDDQGDGTVDRPSGVSLSPGDLDEAIITIMRLTQDAMSGGGVAFESVSAMRIGVFNGIDSCRLGELGDDD